MTLVYVIITWNTLLLLHEIQHNNVRLQKLLNAPITVH